MCGHYLVEPVACTPASGWEKGQVENQVGVLRRRFFVPRPKFRSHAELNAWLEDRCICPATDPRFTYRGEEVVQTLEKVCARVGYPKTLRGDNGSDLISPDLDLWSYANDVTLDFSRPGKPTDNGFIEAFNSKLRSECQNARWCMSLADAREKLGDWRRDYNEVRPLSAIGYNVPIVLHIPDGATSPSS